MEMVAVCTVGGVPDACGREGTTSLLPQAGVVGGRPSGRDGAWRRALWTWTSLQPTARGQTPHSGLSGSEQICVVSQVTPTVSGACSGSSSQALIVSARDS